MEETVVRAVRECGRECLCGVGGVVRVLQVEGLETDEASSDDQTRMGYLNILCSLLVVSAGSNRRIGREDDRLGRCDVDARHNLLDNGLVLPH